MLEAFPSLKGQDAIVVLDASPVLEKLNLLKRVNQKRPVDDFKPNRKMRRQKFDPMEKIKVELRT
jgi:hypothetical protein